MGAPFHVIRHELRLLARGRVGIIALAVLAVVTAYAGYTGAHWRAEQNRTIAAIRAHDTQQNASIAAQLRVLEQEGNPRPALQLAGLPWYLAQPEGAIAPAPHLDPRRAEAAGSEWVGARHALLAPVPLSALAVGQSDLHPYYTRVTIRTRPALVPSDELENPINLLTGRFDLAFVLAVCWPILVLPLVYNVASEERESGTFALVASQPVAWRWILAARLAVRVGAAVAVTLAASIGTLWWLGALSGVELTGALSWVALVLATALFWSGIAVAINARGWSSAANNAALLVAWLLLVIVVPAAIGEVAHAAIPVPSRVQLIAAVRMAGSLTPNETQALIAAYHEDHPDAERSTDAADVTALRGLAQQDEVDRRIEPVLSAYRDAVTRQQQLAERLSVVSPPIVIYDAVADLAGTTAARYRRFAEAVDAFHARWREYFYPLVHARATLTARHYEQAPQFVFANELSDAVYLRVLMAAVMSVVLGASLLSWALYRS